MSLTAALRHKRHWRLLRPEQLLSSFHSMLEIFSQWIFNEFSFINQLQLGSFYNENRSPLNITDHSIKLILKGIWVSIFLIKIISTDWNPMHNSNGAWPWPESTARLLEYFEQIQMKETRHTPREFYDGDNECGMKFGELCHLMKHDLRLLPRPGLISNFRSLIFFPPPCLLSRSEFRSEASLLES